MELKSDAHPSALHMEIKPPVHTAWTGESQNRRTEDTRVIQKISSVCEYCLCSTVVTMVCMGAEFVDSVARQGRNLQTFEQCLRIVLCVYNV